MVAQEKHPKNIQKKNEMRIQRAHYKKIKLNTKIFIIEEIEPPSNYKNAIKYL